MGRPNARQRDGFQRGLSKLRTFAATVGDANSDVVREAAKALTKGLKQVVSVKAPGAAAPGEPPHRHSGGFRKRMGREVVGGVMRVGSGDFRAPWFEFGAVFPAKPGRTIRKGKRKGTRIAAQKARVIAPRPFMRAGLEAAKVDMTRVTVSQLQRTGREVLGG